LALPLIALLTWWSVRRAVAPLRELDRQLAKRQPQDLSPVRLPGAPSELEPALEALNGLLERIEALMAAERRFTADAAHELRTPIAAIRTQAQVALGEGDPDARHHALLATLQGCDRAGHLVQQLLTLSRLEGGAAPAMADLDLRGVARTVLAELAPQALRRGQSIELEADAACQVRGNEVLLAVLLRNLVDNASRYSPDGARVAVKLRAATDAVTLWVEDSGPGLAEADCQRLGERFFRVLGSEQPGSGLGWSIVRRIAAVHAAVVQLGRSADLGGLSVQLRWPAAEARPSGH
jgi:two-component system sensor histidine kinase QseC